MKTKEEETRSVVAKYRSLIPELSDVVLAENNAAANKELLRRLYNADRLVRRTRTIVHI